MSVKLKPETIRSLRGQVPLFEMLKSELNIRHIDTIRRWLRENKENGPLTTKGALGVISKGLKVPEKYLIETES